jgi:hypothetical protein
MYKNAGGYDETLYTTEKKKKLHGTHRWLMMQKQSKTK